MARPLGSLYVLEEVLGRGATGEVWRGRTHEGEEYAFGPRKCVLIGRAADCDVVLVDTKMSRRHLELTYDDGRVIRDLDTAKAPGGRGHG